MSDSTFLTRFPIVTHEEASEEIKAIYEDTMKRFNFHLY